MVSYLDLIYIHFLFTPSFLMNTLSLFLEMCKNTLTLSQFTQIPSESNDSSVKQDDVTLFFLCLLLVTIPFMTTQQLLMRMFTEEYSLNIKVFIYNLIVYILLIIVHSIFMNILNKFCNRMAQKKRTKRENTERTKILIAKKMILRQRA